MDMRIIYSKLMASFCTFVYLNIDAAYLVYFSPPRLAATIPIPCIPRHIPVARISEGVGRHALGLPLPVAPGLRFTDHRSAGTYGFFHPS